MRKRRRYTAEQKARAVRLVHESGGLAAMVARRLRISLSNVSRWVLDDARAQLADKRAARRRELLRRSVRPPEPD